MFTVEEPHRISITINEPPIEKQIRIFLLKTGSGRYEELDELMIDFNNYHITVHNTKDSISLEDVSVVNNEKDKVVEELEFLYRFTLNPRDYLSNLHNIIINLLKQFCWFTNSIEKEFCEFLNLNLPDPALITEFLSHYKLPIFIFNEIFNQSADLLAIFNSTSELENYRNFWFTKMMANTVKTLIGKENYLFLINDSNQELEKHFSSLACSKQHELLDNLNKYKTKLLHINIPDKSVVCKKYLPDYYMRKETRREGLTNLSALLDYHLLDCMPFFLADDSFYRTDTHINLNSATKMYSETIMRVNRLFNWKVPVQRIELKAQKVTDLMTLNIGLGDLTWPMNTQDLKLKSMADVYYYSEQIEGLYCKYVFDSDSNNSNDFTIKVLNKEFFDITESQAGKMLDWNIISSYFLLSECPNGYDLTVLIFYDSMLLSSLALWMRTFKKVLFCKSLLNKDIVENFQHDLILQFSIERFIS